MFETDQLPVYHHVESLSDLLNSMMQLIPNLSVNFTYSLLKSLAHLEPKLPPIAVCEVSEPQLSSLSLILYVSVNHLPTIPIDKTGIAM